jgi:hypothetical protein
VLVRRLPDDDVPDVVVIEQPGRPEVVVCLRPRTRAVGGGSFHGRRFRGQTRAVGLRRPESLVGYGVRSLKAPLAGQAILAGTLYLMLRTAGSLVV